MTGPATPGDSTPGKRPGGPAEQPGGRMYIYYCRTCERRWRGPAAGMDAARCPVCGSSRIGMQAARDRPHREYKTG